MKRISIAVLVVATTTILFTLAAEAETGLTEKQLGSAQENYAPGMGEIMGATQMRHAKLWFAGNARNWALASYELDEIKEGLEGAAKFHPTFKGITGFFIQLRYLGAAIETKDIVRFKVLFDGLTTACNNCHQENDHGFIIIKRPGLSPFSNQEFAVKTK